jgi:hypothetical protein
MRTVRNSSLSRRRFLLAGAGGAVASLAGGGLLLKRYADSRAVWIEQVVRDNLPGVSLDESSLAAFVRDVLAGDLLEPHTHRLSVFAQQTTPWLTRQVPRAREGLDKLERRVLTEYLMGSNFFRIPDPKRETIVYVGPSLACGNPFASLA